jgi:ornithine decarboxylase
MLPSVQEINLEVIRDPFFIYKPGNLKKNVEFFLKSFSGEILYAVKTNPSKFILKHIYELGIKSFDVASINEVRFIRTLFNDAKIFFMNPVKPRMAIKEAYFNYDVRNFSLDTFDELDKILQETNFANDLNLHLRINVSNDFAKIDLSKKFGADGNEAKQLLKKTKEYAKKIGVSFHTGSQCMNPDAYKFAITKIAKLILESKFQVDFVNIGGGFPSKYPYMNPQPLNKYFAVIKKEFLRNFGTSSQTIMLSEPGRVLVSNSMSLILRVDLRKKNNLYVNDGVHGYLHNAGLHGFTYSAKIFREEKKSKLIPFSFYGPTCDSNDFMKGPFLLPDSINEGDFIELESMGAYSVTMKNNFNGFYSDINVFVDKENDYQINNKNNSLYNKIDSN